MNRIGIVAATAVLAAACAASPTLHRTGRPLPEPQSPPVLARLLFVGDVMLGRGVGDAVGADPTELFLAARSAIRRADLAAFNLESPLTEAPHLSSNPNDLRADPGFAPALAAAGFDVASVANNHTGDAGADGLTDTVAALHAAGMFAVGSSRPATAPPLVVEAAGIRVGIAAFTQVESDGGPGLADVWEPGTAEAEVRALAASSDVVVASFHGGSEGIPVPDEEVLEAAHLLSEWGADVVWGHGPHVTHPLHLIERNDGRRTVVATSLGNFLFDQAFEPNQKGQMLEIITTREGPIGFRIARSHHTASGVESIEWQLPTGDAVFLEDDWWSLVTPVTRAPVERAPSTEFDHGDVIAAAWGDITGDGSRDLVVAYRHAFRETPLNRLYPDRAWKDAEGRSAHIGVFTPGGTPIWGAGTLAHPIDEFAPCDGSIAVVYRTFTGDEAGVGALVWHGFGLTDAPILPGSGTPTCADVDGDGRLEPMIVRATSNLRP